MEFLSFLAFIAAWGFMWRWVVKNRGSWNLFYGNIVGAAGGFIVGMVVLSILLSIFPSAHKSAKAPIEDVITQSDVTTSLLPEAESDSTSAVLENAPGFAAIEPDNQPSPPDSALLPNYASRAPKSISEKTVLDQSDAQGRKALTALRDKLGQNADSDESMLAYVMCGTLVTSTLRFPASARFADSSAIVTKRFKDQVYTLSNKVTARNMNGDDVTYSFDCSVQEQPASAEWRLLNLKLQKVGS
ncbi:MULTISPECIES: hypothetical protein [unclassified Pseudomonas]|jgi:hypothetical protein|uniref:hypothetical protein n=1 Tax=Pseudomonas TaxID=286 RepID=UPI0019132330|nr:MULTISPECIES: hypothetical protein [unclassified Pseudomonas]MBK5342255.1 hypothetical protein [Pseudomonas sp. TH49]MCU1773188.1 hypothetical protein [Pseudomonas sp. 13B_3.2_Bac1]